MAERKIKVILVKPGEKARIETIDATLENYQAIVGGIIQVVYPWEDPVGLVCNDEGKLLCLPYNRALQDENGRVYDAICGTFFICGLGEEDFGGLSDALAEKYEKLFHNVQRFNEVMGKILVTEIVDD